jgi:hypothetical protein
MVRASLFNFPEVLNFREVGFEFGYSLIRKTHLLSLEKA